MKNMLFLLLLIFASALRAGDTKASEIKEALEKELETIRLDRNSYVPIIESQDYKSLIGQKVDSYAAGRLVLADRNLKEAQNNVNCYRMYFEKLLAICKESEQLKKENAILKEQLEKFI